MTTGPAQTPTTEFIGDRAISGPHPAGGLDPFEFWLVTSTDGLTLIGHCYSVAAARELAAMPDLLYVARAWSDSYPDLGEPHDSHARGHFHGECSACGAEYKLLLTVERLDYCRGARAP